MGVVSYEGTILEFHLNYPIEWSLFTCYNGNIFHLGLIYIVGGCSHTNRHHSSLLSYNPVTGEWETLASMMIPRSQMGVAILDNHLYVVGGTNKHHDALHSVEKYSFLKVPLLFRLRI